MRKIVLVSAVLLLLLGGLAQTEAVSADFEEARTFCSTNLKQLGLAMRMYAQDYDEYFPDDPKMLFPKHYINTLEILLCPGHTSLNSDSLISYVYVRGLTSKDKQSGILMYDASADNHEGQGRNVLFVGGYVRYIAEKDFKGLLETFLAEYKELVELKPVELPASVAKLADEFKKNYILSSGQVLKHINPPLRPEGGASVMCFRWDDSEGLQKESQGYGKITIGSMLRTLADIYPYEIEGDREILGTQIKGDFILRTGTPQETIVSRLEEILQQNLNIPVKLTFREVERDVIVATGYFKTNLISSIEFYSAKRGGGCSGDFQELMKWIGDYVGCFVVSEVINPPAVTFSWRYNDSKDIAGKDMMLQNLTDQTGLTFKEEKRQARVLFVEKTN